MMGFWQLHWGPCLQPPMKLGLSGRSDPVPVTVLLAGAGWWPWSIPPLQALGHILLLTGAPGPTPRLVSQCRAARRLSSDLRRRGEVIQRIQVIPHP